MSAQKKFSQLLIASSLAALLAVAMPVTAAPFTVGKQFAGFLATGRKRRPCCGQYLDQTNSTTAAKCFAVS